MTRELDDYTKAELRAEVERLREGIRALANEWAPKRDAGTPEFEDAVLEIRQCADELRALLPPSPAATTGEAATLRKPAPDCPLCDVEAFWRGDSCDHADPAPVSSGEARTGALRDELRKAVALAAERPDSTKRRMPTIQRREPKP